MVDKDHWLTVLNPTVLNKDVAVVVKEINGKLRTGFRWLRLGIKGELMNHCVPCKSRISLTPEGN
jgi:hypothetical protein